MAGREPPVGRTKSRQQFLQRKGLDQIIVGTRVQPFDAVGDLVPCGQEDDGGCRRAGPGRGHQGDAVAVRKPAVEQDGTVGILNHGLERFGEAGNMVERPAFPLQDANDLPRQRRVVFHQQDTGAFHRGSLLDRKAGAKLAEKIGSRQLLDRKAT